MHAGLTEGFDGGEEACSAGRAVDGTVLFDLTTTTNKIKKTRRVVEIEIRIETREEHHLLLRGLLLRSIRRPQRPVQPLPPALHSAGAVEI